VLRNAAPLLTPPAGRGSGEPKRGFKCTADLAWGEPQTGGTVPSVWVRCALIKIAADKQQALRAWVGRSVDLCLNPAVSPETVVRSQSRSQMNNANHQQQFDDSIANNHSTPPGQIPKSPFFQFQKGQPSCFSVQRNFLGQKRRHTGTYVCGKRTRVRNTLSC